MYYIQTFSLHSIEYKNKDEHFNALPEDYPTSKLCAISTESDWSATVSSLMWLVWKCTLIYCLTEVFCFVLSCIHMKWYVLLCIYMYCMYSVNMYWLVVYLQSCLRGCCNGWLQINIWSSADRMWCHQISWPIASPFCHLITTSTYK